MDNEQAVIKVSVNGNEHEILAYLADLGLKLIPRVCCSGNMSFGSGYVLSIILH